MQVIYFLAHLVVLIITLLALTEKLRKSKGNVNLAVVCLILTIFSASPSSSNRESFFFLIMYLYPTLAPRLQLTILPMTPIWANISRPQCLPHSNCTSPTMLNSQPLPLPTTLPLPSFMHYSHSTNLHHRHPG